ncbi:MAG: S41 family peptidase [Planctomycetota bacterium]
MKLFGTETRPFACWVLAALLMQTLWPASSVAGPGSDETAHSHRDHSHVDPAAPIVTGSDEQSAAQRRQQFIDRGRDLELEHRWGEAIGHYDKANREFPTDALLYQRLSVARLHHDVIRRMNDRSYLASIRRMERSQALDLYSEVLANLKAHFVEDLQWSRVQLFGTASLEVALTEDDFLQRLLPSVPRERAIAFSKTIHGRLAGRSTATRFDLRANASYAAQIAEDELGLSQTATILEFLSGAVATLGTYTRLLSPDQLKDMYSDIDGNFVGLGVEVKALENALEIVSVIPGGPAEDVGLTAGQQIIAVDGVRSEDAGANHIGDLLRGPEHSIVKLIVQNADGGTHEVSATRRRVEVPCVRDARMVDAENGIGYLKLTNFQKSTPRDVDQVLWKLHREKMRALIIDLRGNPGGLLPAAVDTVDRFIRDGRIVSTRGRNPRENMDFIAHAPNTWDLPIAVLIDGESASASEVFAGAIADHRRGQIVGQKSYGKGRVQGVFPLQTANFGLLLTTSEFFPPSGRPIHHRGVQPSVVVSGPVRAAKVNLKKSLQAQPADATLNAAIRSLAGPAMISQR